VSHELKKVWRLRSSFISECECGWTSALCALDDIARTAHAAHAVEVVREDAIERSDRPPSAAWKQHAAEIIRITARALLFFTSEDVWEHGLRKPDNGSPDGDALGPAMRRARQEGIIEWTGRTTTETKRPQRHNNPKRVWRSLIYEGPS